MLGVLRLNAEKSPFLHIHPRVKEKDTVEPSGEAEKGSANRQGRVRRNRGQADKRGRARRNRGRADKRGRAKRTGVGR